MPPRVWANSTSSTKPLTGVSGRGKQLWARLDESSARLERKMDAHHEQLSTQVEALEATLLGKLDSLLRLQTYERAPVRGGDAADGSDREAALGSDWRFLG